MAPRLVPEYNKMLGTPAPPVDGPSKHAIDSLQKQIDFHVGEANRLKYAQNLHIAISRLPAELLAEVFLYIVESGLRGDNTRFTAGTFSFLQVCRRWKEVAVGFPQLWSWWVAGSFRAWTIFSSRSKNVPISLVWRPQIPASTLSILMDPAVPKRIRQLDFSGTSVQLENLLGALGTNPPSNASSIRLQIFPYDNREPREHLIHFLSSSFPKLSRLDLLSFLPAPSSPVFTTSGLTSLKLFLPYGKKNRYTLFQFSHILQRHPNLRELELNHGAIPQPVSSGFPPVPFTLPHLATLRLYGAESAILGFLDLVGMSSPLHNVVVRFSRPQYFDAPALASTVQKVLGGYYECQGLNRPRKANHLTISCSPEKDNITFDIRSHPVPAPNPRPNLKLQFNGICERDMNAMVRVVFPLFPLEDIRGFAFEGSLLHADVCSEIYGKMKDISYLRLDDVDLWSALEALSSSNRDGPLPIPKLESLTLCHVDVLFGSEEKLLEFLRGRKHLAGHYLTNGLKKLVIRSCRVHEVVLQSLLGELVPNVKWENVTAVGPVYQGSEDESDTDELEDDFEDELDRYYGFFD